MTRHFSTCASAHVLAMSLRARCSGISLYYFANQSFREASMPVIRTIEQGAKKLLVEMGNSLFVNSVVIPDVDTLWKVPYTVDGIRKQGSHMNQGSHHTISTPKIRSAKRRILDGKAHNKATLVSCSIGRNTK